MTLFEALQYVHVIAVMLWLGGGIMLTVVAWRSRAADPVHRLGLVRDMQFLSQRLFGPASGVALLTGIAMVVERPAIGFGDAWIVIGLAGMLVSGAIGGAFLSRMSREALSRLEGGDPDPGPLAAVRRVALIDQAVLLVVVWAMVAKPGL